MAFKSIKCPDCENSLMGFVGVDDQGEARVFFNIELVCLPNDNEDNCGFGLEINADDPPLRLVRSLIEYTFPFKGEVIEVEKDHEKPNILSFDYKNERYGECKTLFSCTTFKMENPNYRLTWYLVQFPQGSAILQHRENILLEADEDNAGIWSLMDFYEKPKGDALPKRPSPFPVPQQIKSRKYPISAYGILYEIEKNLRQLITASFAGEELHKLLKSISFSNKNGTRENIHDRILRRKELEQSRNLGQSNASLIEYLDWSEYIDIFRKKWGDFFVNRFPNQQEARASFISKLKDTQSIRHKVAHMRSGVTKDEITTLKALRETSRNLLHP